MIRFRSTFAFSTFFAAAIAACTNPAGAALDSCTAPITVGTTISSSGQNAPMAEKWRSLTIEFAKLINERGGIELKSCGTKQPVRFVIYDDQSDPATVAALYERLVTVDKVDFLAGPDGTRNAIAAAAVAKKHKIPVVMANIADPQIFRKGDKYVWGTPIPTVANWSARYFDMLYRQTPRPKTIFFVTQDHPTTAAISDFWSKRAEQMGFNVLRNETFAAEQKDFTALILKLRLRRPDVVYISSFAGPSAPLIQQMRKLNLRAGNVHHVMPSGRLAKRIGPALEGVTGAIPWYPGVKGPFADFAEELLKRAGIDVFDAPQTMSRIVAYLIMVQAIERAGAVDREKVRQVLHTGTFDAPTGSVSFDETGFAHRNGAVTLQIQKGRPFIVWPPELATGKVLYPSPS
ncbi:MAG: amino acid ABC transporter substrate-binding protein [Alphaproteobacteria bacterium]